MFQKAFTYIIYSLSFCLSSYFILSVYSFCLCTRLLSSLSLFICCFSSCYAAGEWAFAALFFMNGPCCLLSDKAISVGTDDEHIQCDHTNFLFVYSPSSDWLSLSSQWQRLWGCECVLLVVHAFARVGQNVEGSLWASFLVITDKNILFPRERQSSFSIFFFSKWCQYSPRRKGHSYISEWLKRCCSCQSWVFCLKRELISQSTQLRIH